MHAPAQSDPTDSADGALRRQAVTEAAYIDGWRQGAGLSAFRVEAAQSLDKLTVWDHLFHPGYGRVQPWSAHGLYRFIACCYRPYTNAAPEPPDSDHGTDIEAARLELDEAHEQEHAPDAALSAMSAATHHRADDVGRGDEMVSLHTEEEQESAVSPAAAAAAAVLAVIRAGPRWEALLDVQRRSLLSSLALFGKMNVHICVGLLVWQALGAWNLYDTTCRTTCSFFVDDVFNGSKLVRVLNNVRQLIASMFLVVFFHKSPKHTSPGEDEDPAHRAPGPSAKATALTPSAPSLNASLAVTPLLTPTRSDPPSGSDMSSRSDGRVQRLLRFRGSPSRSSTAASPGRAGRRTTPKLTLGRVLTGSDVAASLAVLGSFLLSALTFVLSYVHDQGLGGGVADSSKSAILVTYEEASILVEHLTQLLLLSQLGDHGVHCETVERDLRQNAVDARMGLPLEQRDPLFFVLNAISRNFNRSFWAAAQAALWLLSVCSVGMAVGVVYAFRVGAPHRLFLQSPAFSPACVVSSQLCNVICFVACPGARPGPQRHRRLHLLCCAHGAAVVR